MNHALLGIAVALSACAHTAATTKAPAAPAVFELGEVTMFEGDEPVFKLHADGATEIGFRSLAHAVELEPGQTFSTKGLPYELKAGPTLAADGTLRIDGRDTVRANLDGTLTVIATKARVDGITITADRVRIQSPKGAAITLELGADGTLTQHGGNKLDDRPVRVTGADTPGKRRAILTLVGLALAPGKRVAPTTIEADTPAP
ncbi:MAG: hypothetical protein KIT31_19360 [Deltaproteobacteria bacterium]|nr:hypothetical protein [Deltaproteobacteria bacterium]